MTKNGFDSVLEKLDPENSISSLLSKLFSKQYVSEKELDLARGFIVGIISRKAVCNVDLKMKARTLV